MTGPLLHGRQTCSLIPVGVEVDLTAPRHRARRTEDPPTMWAPLGGKHRAERWPLPIPVQQGYGGCPCPCHVVPGVSHGAPCCYPTLEDRPMQTNNADPARFAHLPACDTRGEAWFCAEGCPVP